MTERKKQLTQMNHLNNMVSMNLTETGVYAHHPALMAYSQPDISAHVSPFNHHPMSYVYMHPAQHHLYTRGSSIEHPHPSHMPHTSELTGGIHSTYSMPDLNHNHQYSMSPNGTTIQVGSGFVTTANMPAHQNDLLLHQNGGHVNHTVYNPYPRANSSSTPDLALQTHGRSNANNSPDLVSRRNLQHSVDDLTEIVRSDVGNQEEINCMTSQYEQFVTTNHASSFGATNEHIPPRSNLIQQGYIPPTPSIRQPVVPSHRLDVETPSTDSTHHESNGSEHTYENLPSALPLHSNEWSDSGVKESHDTRTTTDQIGFDNPAYGMPTGIDVVDATDGGVGMESDAVSQSLDISIPLHSHSNSISSAASSYLLPDDKMVSATVIL